MTDQIPPGIDDQDRHLKGVVEALLFVNEKPVALEQIKGVLETLSAAEIKQVIRNLSEEYDQRQSGMKIVEIAGGYQMLSNPGYAGYIRDFYKTKHKEKLSKPSLETLAIVAYKQPVTRTDVELIRGVNSDGVIAHLLTKELVKPVGRKDVPGRPFLYGTTRQFLEYFGLKSLEDLPTLEEFQNLAVPAPVEPEEGAGQTVGQMPLPLGHRLPEGRDSGAAESSVSEGHADNAAAAPTEVSAGAVAVEASKEHNENNA